MDFASFDEFWKALGRLYDSTLQNTEDIRELRSSIAELKNSTAELRNSTEDLRDASQHLLTAVDKHERRLDRAEITIEAILEDLRRHREGHSPQ